VDGDARDEQAAEAAANSKAKGGTDETAVPRRPVVDLSSYSHTQRPAERREMTNAELKAAGATSAKGGVDWFAGVAALIAAGLGGVAAIIKAWAQLLFARADMIRARSGQPDVERDRGEAESGDGAGGGSSQTDA